MLNSGLVLQRAQTAVGGMTVEYPGPGQ